MSKSCFMQDLKPDVFLHTMQSAALYNMPKLLACCEYHVATIFMKTRDTALVVQCMTDQLLLQSCIRLHLVGALAFKSSQDQACSKQQKCECHCCRRSCCICKAIAPPPQGIMQLFTKPARAAKDSSRQHDA